MNEPTFYISGDIEGMCGYRPGLDQSAQDRIQHAHYIAAAEGLREGGVSRVLLKSFHGVPGEYPDFVETGLPRVPGEFDLPRLAELKPDALALVGFHGIPPHCGWGHAYRFSNLWLNGKPIGEITIQVYRAAVAGVPAALYAGDAYGAKEFRDAAPEAVVVTLRPGGLNLDEGPLDDVKLAELRAGAKKAASLAGRITLPKLPSTFRLEAPMGDGAAAALVPKVLAYPVAVEGKRVVFESSDFLDAYRFFHDMFNLSVAVRRPVPEAAK